MLPEGLMFTVCWLRLPGNTYPVVDYLEKLYQSDYDCFLAVIDAMDKLRDSKYLREPLVKALKGNNVRNILEMRIIGGQARHYARLPLVYTPQRQVILLFGETKKGVQPHSSFINRAISYRNMLNSQEATYEEIDTTIFE